MLCLHTLVVIVDYYFITCCAALSETPITGGNGAAVREIGNFGETGISFIHRIGGA